MVWHHDCPRYHRPDCLGNVAVRKGARITYDNIFTAALVGIPSGVVFSRLLHVIDNITVAKLHPELAASGAVFDYSLHPAQIIGGSGLTIWGAVLGARSVSGYIAGSAKSISATLPMLLPQA